MDRIVINVCSYLHARHCMLRAYTKYPSHRALSRDFGSSESFVWLINPQINISLNLRNYMKNEIVII